MSTTDQTFERYWCQLIAAGIQPLPLIIGLKDNLITSTKVANVVPIKRNETPASWNMRYRRFNFPTASQMECYKIQLKGEEIDWKTVPDGWKPIKVGRREPKEWAWQEFDPFTYSKLWYSRGNYEISKLQVICTSPAESVTLSAPVNDRYPTDTQISDIMANTEDYLKKLEKCGFKPFPPTSVINLEESSRPVEVEMIKRPPNISSVNMYFRKLNWLSPAEISKRAIPGDSQNILWDLVPEGWSPIKKGNQWIWQEVDPQRTTTGYWITKSQDLRPEHRASLLTTAYAEGPVYPSDQTIESMINQHHIGEGSTASISMFQEPSITRKEETPLKISPPDNKYPFQDDLEQDTPESKRQSPPHMETPLSRLTSLPPMESSPNSNITCITTN